MLNMIINTRDMPDTITNIQDTLLMIINTRATLRMTTNTLVTANTIILITAKRNTDINT